MTLTLAVRDLDLVLDPTRRRLHVLRGIDLDLRPGETLGVIGESGSGKTMMGMSLLRLEPPGAHLTAATMQLGNTDLLQATPAALQSLRGRTIGMIFQDPVGAFNPAKRIAWHARAVLDRPTWHPAAKILLAEVDITDPDRVLAAYPHQLSGGMLQRVLIALVLAANPRVVVADEPTTNLDNIVEKQILALFRKLRGQNDTAFIFITHDMTVAATISDRIAVMYAGEIVELAPTPAIFASPLHPYTKALIATARALESETTRLPELVGEPPALSTPRTGCAFASRCSSRLPPCTEAPITMRVPTQAHQVRCILYDHV